ncbi:2-phospho-L-lactate guanylyltransferase [Candidatus Nitrosotenuis uzonensis]|uniref:2-phospho-L-lactate guanylyltransferase n=1 Tax=Candidatus Nitrosotenuis uzonensis TaxID=1407055 RepID=V6ASF0_9ARCH|nr:2-phospho-L-lactate guanylyltransferase [Candidatus Nitrosotenuis uzonensis]CDI05368.1 2-phospho-L-lactate guanylyltransferase [Candidatus Nitrosotenuis uzonensis]
MQIAAIIPVKTFSRAKSRLGLPQEKTAELCKLMLDEVLSAISQTPSIQKIIVVSRDEDAFKLARKYGVKEIFDQSENGVNEAVALAEKFLLEIGFDSSVVFPQDIPLVRPHDIQTLLSFQKWDNSMIVVPSRKFDGTNALLRTPLNVVETHYDEDSYKIHLTTGKSRNVRTSFALINRIMWDVDDKSDVEFIMSNIEKQELAIKLQNILERR